MNTDIDESDCIVIQKGGVTGETISTCILAQHQLSAEILSF
jgi:hypothetical protein